MRYTPIATDALCPMPARVPHVTEKGYTTNFLIQRELAGKNLKKRIQNVRKNSSKKSTKKSVRFWKNTPEL
jgi:hypothetical protein